MSLPQSNSMYAIDNPMALEVRTRRTPGIPLTAASTGKVTEGSVVSHTVKTTPPSPYGRALRDGDVVQERDVSVLLPTKNLGFTPDLGMGVTFDGEQFDVVGLNPLYSGDSVCAYEVQLRQ